MEYSILYTACSSTWVWIIFDEYHFAMKCDNKNWNIYLYVQCREIGYETHEEILRVLHELHTTMKTYHSYQGEYRQAENKLRITETQRQKLEQSLPPEKLDRSKKYRVLEKEVQKVSVQNVAILESVLWWMFVSSTGGGWRKLNKQRFHNFCNFFCYYSLHSAAYCTGLFEMIVGVLTTCHTQYTWDRSICIFLYFFIFYL